jgi:hypothetical protein
VTTDPQELAPSAPGDVLRELRRARRQQRLADVHWFDALYQAYVTGVVCVLAVVLLSGLVGDERISAATRADVVDRGPAVIGLVVAAVVAAGIRSGSRGGPLSLEAADVRHVLLSPVDRRTALLAPAVRQVRTSTFATGVAGAAVGLLAARRLGGHPASWVASGALTGVVAGALGTGAALLASGRRLGRAPATVLAAALLAWAVADVAGPLPAPTSAVGGLALWPLELPLVDLVAPVAAAVVVAAGLAAAGGLSLEAAERRSALVAQLRFAVTMQDLRTVVLLRRQLAAEQARYRPWVRARPIGRLPVWSRGVWGLLRWPAVRLARVAALGIGAGVALRAMWAGTTPLVVVAGLALYVAALDAVDALAEEVDHPGRHGSVPVPLGSLLVRHLAVPVAVLVPVAALALGVAVVVPLDGDAGGLPAALAVLAVLPAALAAVAGGAVSVVKGSPEASPELAMAAPEAVGVQLAVRAVLPPAIAVAGVLPLLAARAARGGDTPPAGVLTTATIPVVLLFGLVVGWLLVREAIARWWRDAAELTESRRQARAGAAGGSAAGDGHDDPDDHPTGQDARP